MLILFERFRQHSTQHFHQKNLAKQELIFIRHYLSIRQASAAQCQLRATWPASIDGGIGCTWKPLHRLTERLARRLAGWLSCWLSEQIIFLNGGEPKVDMLQCLTLGKPSKCVCVGVSMSVEMCALPWADECRHCLIAAGWTRRACAHRDWEEEGRRKRSRGGREGGHRRFVSGLGYQGDLWGLGVQPRHWKVPTAWKKGEFCVNSLQYNESYLGKQWFSGKDVLSIVRAHCFTNIVGHSHICCVWWIFKRVRRRQQGNRSAPAWVSLVNSSLFYIPTNILVAKVGANSMTNVNICFSL